jgi:hypothetical protein
VSILYFPRRIAPAIQLIDPAPATRAVGARTTDACAAGVLRQDCVVGGCGPRQQITAAVAMSRQTVGLWRQRFVTQRVLGLDQDTPRGRGRPQGAPGSDRTHPENDDSHEAARRHPLVYPHLGVTPADESHVSVVGLDRAWAAPSSGTRLQVQSGSALPRETGGGGEVVYVSA